jgi:HEAT repeat protein
MDCRIAIAVPGPPGFSEARIHRQTAKRKPELEARGGTFLGALFELLVLGPGLLDPPQPTGAREIEVGDQPFDDAFSVEGPMRLVCMLLDAKTRRLLLALNAGGSVEVVRGELRADVAASRISDVLPKLLDLGRRWAQPIDIVQLLAENVLHDPEPAVRLCNLVLLVRECAWGARTVETLRKACSDASPEVRLRAATELGAEGRDVLIELAEGKVDDALSAQAVSNLGSELSFERTETLLTRSLQRGRSKTALACLELLGKCGAAAVEVLAKAMASEEGELAVAAAQALGMTGSVAAEPALLAALTREVTDLRVPAANALGRVGSAAAILPLKEAAGRSVDPEVRGAIRQAVAEIQYRLPGASPGQLSLAGVEAGQLSLAQAEAGQLSVAQAEAGQLSVADDPAGRVSLSGDEEGPQ